MQTLQESHVTKNVSGLKKEGLARCYLKCTLFERIVWIVHVKQNIIVRIVWIVYVEQNIIVRIVWIVYLEQSIIVSEKRVSCKRKFAAKVTSHALHLWEEDRRAP